MISDPKPYEQNYCIVSLIGNCTNQKVFPVSEIPEENMLISVRSIAYKDVDSVKKYADKIDSHYKNTSMDVDLHMVTIGSWTAWDQTGTISADNEIVELEKTYQAHMLRNKELTEEFESRRLMARSGKTYDMERETTSEAARDVTSEAARDTISDATSEAVRDATTDSVRDVTGEARDTISDAACEVTSQSDAPPAETAEVSTNNRLATDELIYTPSKVHYVIMSFMNPINGSLIHGFKINGIFPSIEEAETFIKKVLQMKSQSDNFLIAEVGKWYKWSTNDDNCENIVWGNDDVNTLMSEYNKTKNSDRKQHDIFMT